MQIGLPLGVSRTGGGGGSGGGGGGLGLKFDIATASAGAVFSDSDTTVTNPTANIRSAKATAGITPNAGNNWYWEFTVRSSTQQMYVGFGLPGFVCDGVNRIGIVANSVAYNTGTGQVIAGGAARTTVAASTAAGDVIGFKLEVFNPGSLLTILKNNVVILNQFDTSAWITDNSVAWTPIWSGLTVANSSTTISNNIYEHAGYTPIGTATTIAASASVTPVADGKYDVYTFNSSGTFTTTGPGTVRALVIAGGGARGGGAGGYQEKAVVTTPQTYAITVGAGSPAISGSNVATNSSFGTALVSTRGGHGALDNGGSGGGGASAVGTGTFAPGTGIVGQGFNGGYATADLISSSAGGGGGGAGGLGGDSSGGSTNVGGAGGIGLASSITGTSILRGGGGAGYGAYDNNGIFSAGTASAGGGQIGVNGGNAFANTGGGGPAPSNGNGGSGVIIIRVRARA